MLDAIDLLWAQSQALHMLLFLDDDYGVVGLIIDVELVGRRFGQRGVGYETL